ncbi:MAG: hypothetical protein BWY09_02825 [Candidatus Hydrogenedentes bacterium ADurb.Bin179]|nr:MAG: hypothetical protein BWY09_02825 [Candidatus Hydrogenedentes bacterium ADurb.Bin179]
MLLLPGIESIPVETFRQIKNYVLGGGAVIALERIPESATGLQNNKENNEEVRQISTALFRQPLGAEDDGMNACGAGKTFCLKQVLEREDPLDWRVAPLDPFLKTLRLVAGPDLKSERVPPGRGNDEGIAFIHRQSEDKDIYFVVNLQHTPSTGPLGFRVTRGRPYWWDPSTGVRQPVASYSRADGYTRLPISLAPFESRFIVFEDTNSPLKEETHVMESDFAEVLDADRNGFTALAVRNGLHAYRFHTGTDSVQGTAGVEGIPSAYVISGNWNVTFPGEEGLVETLHWPALKSWTDDSLLRHFSGTAHYSIVFTLPEEYGAEDVHLRLSLGEVGTIADIRINGKPVGVHWMSGQEFGLNGIVHAGENTLKVEVINTLINRVSGLDAFPEVSEELRPFFGTGIRASNPAAEALLHFEALPRSGLLGPVCITPFKRIRVEPPPAGG